MNHKLISKRDLIGQGYTKSHASNLFRRARLYMLRLGYEEYGNKKIRYVPQQAIDDLLGLNHFSNKEE